MGKTVEFPIKMGPAVFWSAEFDNSPRHCWPDKNTVYRVDGKWEKICGRDHSPKLAGKVEWMRFIHSVNEIILSQLFEQDNIRPTEDIEFSEVGGFGEPRQLGRDMHSGDGNHWPACEIYPDWIVFLDNKYCVAYIELHNEDLIWVAEKAYNEVQASYG